MSGAVELATAYIALVPSLKGASQKISEQLSPAASEAGGKAGDGLGRGIVSMAAKWAAPLAAAVGFGAVLKTGFDEAKDAAAGTAQLAAGIQSTGNAAHVSVDGLNNLASSIQDYSGQTDDSIVKSEQLLLTFTNIKNNGPDKIFDQATVAAADMAAKFGGDASQQAVLLGKALNDPVKGISALQRVGVSFTDSQKNTIAALVKTGDVAGAQKVILKELGTEFGGAAKAAGESFPGQLQRLHRAFEDLSQGVVQGFLPVLGPPIEGAIRLMKLITPAIGGAAAAVSGEAGKIGGALGAVFSLLKTGNFTGGIRKALGVEEDSPVVSSILKIRDTMIPVFGQIRQVFAQIGPVASSMFGGLMSTIGPLLPQIFSLAGAFSPFQIVLKSIAPLLPQLGAVFGQLATVLGSTLKTALATMVPLFVQLSTVVSHALSGVLAAVLPAVVQLVLMLGKTLSQLLPVVMPIVGVILTLATTLISQLVPIITQLVASVLPPVVQIFGLLLTVIAPLITMLAGLLIPIIQALMPVVTTVFGVVANVITTVMQVVLGVIQVVTGIISGNWAQVWAGVKNIFAGIWNTIVSVLTGVLAIIWSVISAAFKIWVALVSTELRIIGAFFASVWNGIVGVLSAVFSTIWAVLSGAFNLWLGFVRSTLSGIAGFFSSTWSGIIGGVSGFISGFLKFFTGLPARVTGALAGAGSWLYNVGRDIINGLIDGVGSMMGAIGNAILSLVPGPIVGVFKAALGIHSPSTVFRGFGKNIVEGLILGTDDKAQDLTSTMHGLVTVPDIPAGAASLPVSGAGGRGGVTNNWTINQVDDPVGTSHAIARRQNALAV